MGITETTITIILVLSTIDVTTPFVFDSPTKCPVDGACFCYGDELNCEGQDLTTFPSFKPTSIPNGHFAVNMAENPISMIPGKAFLNLKASNATEFDLFFPGCNISSIQRDAFLGIEDRIIQLFLDENELTTFPDELQKLTNVKELSMENNPISTLSSSSATLSSLGKSLEMFYMSLSLFKTWPVELSYLKSVRDLQLSDVPFTDLPLNAFSSLDNSLERLSIFGSDFVSVPEAICNLQNLSLLQIEDSYQLSMDSLFDKCTKQMQSVYTLVLISNDFDDIPNVFGTFPSLLTLILDNNGLSTIRDRDIPANTTIGILHLNSNNFTSIPTALGKMALLTDLYLESNLVQSIGERDFVKFGNLRRLSLKGNPLQSISDGAFKHTPLLEEIDLSETRLRILPASLSSLRNLRNLNLERNPTDCTCALAALKTWDVSHVAISANCGTNPMAVITYITHGLQSCP